MWSDYLAIFKLAKAIAVAWLNTIAGIVFGILKTIFILSVIIFFINKIDTKSQMIDLKDKTESFLYQPIENVAPIMFPALNDLQKKGERFLKNK